LAEEENNSTRARVLDARPQLYGNKQFSQADKALRQALPLVKGDNQLEPVVLFQLGVADFQLGKASKNRAMMQDTLKFSKQSAAVKSPVQTDAKTM
jgi:hypothetical protein